MGVNIVELFHDRVVVFGGLCLLLMYFFFLIIILIVFFTVFFNLVLKNRGHYLNVSSVPQFYYPVNNVHLQGW